MSFQQFLETLDGGAREHSQAPPWQQHLASLGPPIHIPRGVQRALPQREQQQVPSFLQRQGISPSEFERMLDPRLTEGLQLARRQHGSAEDLMRSLGLEHDGGEPPQGFLNSAFRVIDYPRALTFNAFRALLDPDMGMDEFREALDQREGFGELSGLVMQEDDSGVTRAWKGLAAFAGDVATDPLMLVSLGAIPAGKKMGMQMVEKAISKRAVGLGDDALQAVQKRAIQGEARFAAKRQGQDLSEEALAQVTQRVGSIAPDQLVGNLAAEAYSLGGATGLREFMYSLGKGGKQVWNDLPADIKGGLRIRVPFAREEDLVRKVIPIAGGGGQLSQALGLRPLVTKTHQIRGAVRASQASKGLHKAISGAYGDLYGKMGAELVERGLGQTSGMTYHMWRTADKARRAAEQARGKVLSAGNETAAKVFWRLDNAGDERQVKEAWEAFNRYAMDPGELDRFGLGTGLEIDELGNLFANIGGEARGLSNAEALGLGSAAEYHHLLRTLVTDAQAAGVDIGILNDYLPLVLTEQRAQWRGAKKAGLAKRAGKMEAGYDPPRRREMGVELRFVEDEEGVVRSVLQPLGPDEVNLRVKARAEATGGKISPEAYFEEDLGVMLQRYTAAIGHIVSEAKYARIVRNSGLVSDGDSVLVPALRNRTMADAQKKVDEGLDLLRRVNLEDPSLVTQPALPGLGGPSALRQAVQSILTDADANRVVIHRMLWNPELTPEDQVRIAGDILTSMDSWLAKLPSGEEAGKVLNQASKKFRQAQTKVKEAARPDLQAGETSMALQELGLKPITQVDAASPIRKVPPELRLAFAPEAMRDAIHKFYKLQGPQAQTLADKWYRPYHAMFKMTATIGRGPGFHIRNAWGGTINNMMYGATPEDAWMMSRIVKQMMEVSRQARKEVAAEKRWAKEGGKVRESRGYWEAVHRRSEELLEPRLRPLKATKNMDGWEFYRTMSDTPDILWGKQGRSFEALNEAGVEGMGQGGLGSLAKSRTYPGLAQEDLSAAQRGVEHIRNLWWMRANANAAEMTEAYLRGTAFLHGMRKYNDPEIARLGTLITQFDYHDLSHFERHWMRGTLLPFYTWTRYNLPFQMRTLFQQPGRMNALNRIVENAENAFGDEDADVLPEWMKSRFGFVSRFEFGGNPLMLGVETPAQDLNEYFKVGSIGASISGMGKAFGSALNPAFSVPMQMAWGTEFFTGATLDEHSQRLAPRWYQALAAANIVPQWVDPKTGDILGDARIITGVPGGIPWLGQGEKVLSILGAPGINAADYPEGRNRRASDAIRMFFPVVTAGTLTPQSESGELFQRTRRLRTQAARRGSIEDQQMVQQLQAAGLTLEQIAMIMEARRAREEN